MQNEKAPSSEHIENDSDVQCVRASESTWVKVAVIFYGHNHQLKQFSI